MFRGVNKEAQKIINDMAQKEAKYLNHPLLLPEHIILAILREGDNIAVRVLKSLGLDIESLGRHIVTTIGSGNNTKTAGSVMPSPRLQKVLQASANAAKDMKHDYIGVEHLLLGVFDEGAGTVYNLLSASKITRNMLRLSVLKELGVHPVVQHQMELFEERRVDVKTPVLDQFSTDLTGLAEKGKIDPVIGRDEEIERVVQILSRRSKNNPILVGEPGVGKTAIVEGLAHRIIAKNVPSKLFNKRVCSLELSSVIAGTKYRGEFEERIRNIMNEVRSNADIILFIDEAHTILGAGGAEGAIDAANLLKPALARGDIRCIGATTMDEYRKYFERDAALVRRFQMVDIDEPSVEDSIRILSGIREKYEEYHKVHYTTEALKQAVLLSKQYMTEKKLPDKAIDLIDEAGARAGIKQSFFPEDITNLETNITDLDVIKDKFINQQDYEKAAEYRDKIKKLSMELADRKAHWEGQQKENWATIDVDDIQDVISKITKIPLRDIQTSENEKLLKLEEELHKRVIGQDKAITAISNAIRRSRVGLGSKRRPNGSFLFLGPTGVGKTELAKSLAEYLFGSDERLIRIDMSEFMEKHSISRLIGSPPGYVGYEEGGLLTDKIRRNPYSVILLDEVEKAHPDIFNILLQIFEEGELSDHKGNVVNFRNTIVILTSNVGVREASHGAIGFGFENKNVSIEKQFLKAVEEKFEPEFINRLDEVITFHALDKEDIRKIARIHMSNFVTEAAVVGMQVSFSEKVIDFLADDGFDAKYGARPLRRLITTSIENELALAFLKGKIDKESEIRIDYSIRNKKIVFKQKNIIR